MRRATMDRQIVDDNHMKDNVLKPAARVTDRELPVIISPVEQVFGHQDKPV